MESETVVKLKCVLDGGKLRVRITSDGYSSSANCRFPRDIRVEGKGWEVEASAVKLQGTTKFYYTISTKGLREVKDKIKIDVFDVTEEGECVVCSNIISDDDMIIIAPCGHKCACLPCLSKCKNCPICRGPLNRLVKKSELE